MATETVGFRRGILIFEFIGSEKNDEMSCPFIATTSRPCPVGATQYDRSDDYFLGVACVFESPHPVARILPF